LYPLCSPTGGVVKSVQDTIRKVFNRNDPTVKAYHDVVAHVALFAAAVFLIQRYGHKLAV
jgi:hypothetical protein